MLCMAKGAVLTGNLQILGEQIRYYRKLNNVTQKELAAKLGVAPRYIGHIEQGRRGPSLDMLVAVCQWFGVSMSDILPIGAKCAEKEKLIAEIVDVLHTWKTPQVRMLGKMVHSMKG